METTTPTTTTTTDSSDKSAQLAQLTEHALSQVTGMFDMTKIPDDEIFEVLGHTASLFTAAYNIMGILYKSKCTTCKDIGHLLTVKRTDCMCIGEKRCHFDAFAARFGINKKLSPADLDLLFEQFKLYTEAFTPLLKKTGTVYKNVHSNLFVGMTHLIGRLVAPPAESI